MIEWLLAGRCPVAWLALDEGDGDLSRFLVYLVAAMQTALAGIGEGITAILQSPQPPPIESLLTTLINEIDAAHTDFILVLDDYHTLDSVAVDQALAFLVEHLPAQMHLVIATREDPSLPLARLRTRGQLTELRAADLRFTLPEAAEFLRHVMGLDLSAEHIAALEARTEGWIAGLQLAGLSMQGQQDVAGFVRAFSGSHHFVMDYLIEEVLRRQTQDVQAFLLRTSILDRLCGPLCDAVLPAPAGSGQAMLEHLERANLFVIPLDNDRCWYRYHHLFAELLRQRLSRGAASAQDGEPGDAATYHIRASRWYEENGLDLDAFQHAAAAHNIDRAEWLIYTKGMPLHLPGAVKAALDWLESLPKEELDARPSLWVTFGSYLLVSGQTTGVEEKLQAAEAALQRKEPDDKTQDLHGRIASARATLALTRYQVDAMITQSRLTMQHLQPDSQSYRTALWTLGFAYQLAGDRVLSRQNYNEAIALSQPIGDIFTTILAMTGLGNIQESENQLPLAFQSYQKVLQLSGDHPFQIIHEVHLGLARISYQWNDLDAALLHGEEGLRLARQYDRVIDRYVSCEVFLGLLKLAQGDVNGAAAMLEQAAESVRQHDFIYRAAEVASAQVLIFLRQGNLEAAAQLAQTHEDPISLARVHLAQGHPSAALAVLDSFRRQVETKSWKNELLRVLVLQAVAFPYLPR